LIKEKEEVVTVKWPFIGLGRVSDDLYCRHPREDAADTMDIHEEDEVDSIMDEDKSERAGEQTGEVDGDEEGTTPKFKGKKSGRKSELDMAALTDEQAALVALENNQLLHLRLRKRCYSTKALNFIRLVEEAADIILKLLGSTHKPEVMESMEFSRSHVNINSMVPR
jgi:condensin complex subunit 1